MIYIDAMHLLNKPIVVSIQHHKLLTLITMVKKFQGKKIIDSIYCNTYWSCIDNMFCYDNQLDWDNFCEDIALLVSIRTIHYNKLRMDEDNWIIN
jgi:hypothetical protein